ncbi:MAG TPA: 4-phosphopantoate--beta-alanine ligase [Candidatus Thermoplasmatota archaeon]|nr:4-phosphopantoate--beta-alanine ligase [Candidatus Thermoplasmatota archaeon]
MKKIPRSHPRYLSLQTRETLSRAVKQKIVHQTGLIAHGRGEAFDYLLGETTIPQADKAARVAAAALFSASNPVISINGNVAALAAKECVMLSETIPAKLEVNLFHRTQARVNRIVALLRKNGASTVYGVRPTARIPGLTHDRALCDRRGIFSADVVLVPLEDGDRCEALLSMGKTVIAIDLNPLSRTAKAASITIVDNVTRAIPRIDYWAQTLSNAKESDLRDIVRSWDNKKNLGMVFVFLSKRLNSLS